MDSRETMMKMEREASDPMAQRCSTFSEGQCQPELLRLVNEEAHEASEEQL